MMINQNIEHGEKGHGNNAFPEVHYRQTERGVVMVLVLVVSAVALVLAAALIVTVITGTRISGGQKKYANAREAGKGCSAVFMQLIETRGSGPLLTDFTANTSAAGLNVAITTPAACTAVVDGTPYASLSAKLMATSINWVGCNTNLTIDPADNTTYDMSAVIGTTTQYSCYAKIISATQGNSGGVSGTTLRTKGVVSVGGAEIKAMPVPYLYAIEVLAQQTTNPAERSRLSVLFQF